MGRLVLKTQPFGGLTGLGGSSLRKIRILSLLDRIRIGIAEIKDWVYG